MDDWTKSSKKQIDAEFERLLYAVLEMNGGKDLVGVVVGIPNTEEKRDFIVGWHENDE